MASCKALTLLLCCLWTGTFALDQFLQKSRDHGRLLPSLEDILGPQTISSQLDDVEDRMRPMFLSLPKNDKDFLNPPVARYALQRMMADMHGWDISELGSMAGGGAFADSVVGSGMLKGLVPENIEKVFEETVGADGFGLRDLSILAATVAQLVHSDQYSILHKVCEVFDWPTMGRMNETDMQEMILMYGAIFLVGSGLDGGVDLAGLTSGTVTALLQAAPKSYPGWEDTVLFVDDEIETFAFNARASRNPFIDRESSFQVASNVVERIADHYSRRVAEMECHEIRDDLLTYEMSGTGRIRLADFYRASLDARFFYTETKEYLQAIGALDDSDPIVGPKVITTNYVLAKTNCLAHSHFYNICCLNECEELYGKLEQSIAGAETTPSQVSSLVSAMSSSTVQAPRNLSASLLVRLEEIALAHRGIVHVHSRLFSQWMHQAFPRECPYPHLSGTTTSLSPTDWSDQTGLPHRIDTEAGVSRSDSLTAAIDQLEATFASDTEVDPSNDEFMWTSDEETFVATDRDSMSILARTVAHVGACVGLLGVIYAVLVEF